jgi:hypothetical protein
MVVGIASVVRSVPVVWSVLAVVPVVPVVIGCTGCNGLPVIGRSVGDAARGYRTFGRWRAVIGRSVGGVRLSDESRIIPSITSTLFRHSRRIGFRERPYT